MSRCIARLPLGSKPREVISPSGWLHFEEPRRCSQVVAVTPIHADVPAPAVTAGWAACPVAGHLDDVLAQLRTAEAMERARHDWEADQRPTVAPHELARDCGRPEMARLLR